MRVTDKQRQMAEGMIDNQEKDGDVKARLRSEGLTKSQSNNVVKNIKNRKGIRNTLSEEDKTAILITETKAKKKKADAAKKAGQNESADKIKKAVAA